MRLTRAMVHSATCQINGGVTIRARYEDGDASNYDVSDGRRHCHVIYVQTRVWSIAELTVATRWGGSSALARAGAPPPPTITSALARAVHQPRGVDTAGVAMVRCRQCRVATMA